MTKNEALEESDLQRLNNDEFLSYIPHLELEEILMTQIKVSGSWSYMFNSSFNKRNELSSLQCFACQEYVECEKFSIHLKKYEHEVALESVQQFYHPYYTYAKDCEKIACGAEVSKADMRNAIVQTNEASSNLMGKKIQRSKKVAQHIREHDRDIGMATSKNNLTNMVLTKDINKCQDMLTEVKLPLSDLLNIEFSVEDGKWVRMLTINKNARTKFYCALCSKFCFGVITVDCHFKGVSHKRAQLACLGVRCLSYKYLTKNCIYGYGEKFSFEIKRNAKTIFQQQTLTSDDADKQENTVQENETETNEIEEGILDDVLKTAKPSLSTSVVDKVKKLKEKMQLQNTLVEGLIGVEYVVKILKTTTDKQPMYECCLCEIVLNENRMQGHLTGYNHRLKYCELHYPDTIKKFKNVIGHVKYIDYFNAMSYILSKIAIAIEQHHGRSMPYVVLSSKFTKVRTELIAQIYSYPNACQQHGPSFTNVISDEEINQILKEHTEYVGQANNYTRFAENPGNKLYLNQRCHDPNSRNGENFEIRKRKRSQSPHVKRKYSEVSSRSCSPQTCISSKRSKQSEHHSANTSILSSLYRDEIAVARSEIERMYNEYRKNPESHPLYDEEWNGFWRRRKEQLIAQGNDHRSHNYQPEWVKYFNKRIEELFEREIDESKREIRKRLNISDSVANSTSMLLEPIFSSVLKQDIGDEFRNQKIASADILHPIRNAFMRNDEDISINPYSGILESKMTDGKPTVIHVLRLLTALEDYLGSLGTKIMDLLSKALMLEKQCNNPVELEQQILTFNNCTLLETAVEKLKGILFAGLLDRNKLQGFNRVIQFATDLLKYADKMGWRNMPTSLSHKLEKPEFQKLADVVQNTRNSTFPSTQKSLSDTLMELLSMQKNGVQSNFNQTMYHEQNQGKICSDIEQFGMNTNLQRSQGQNLGSNPPANFVVKPSFGNICFGRNYNEVNSNSKEYAIVPMLGIKRQYDYKPIENATNYVPQRGGCDRNKDSMGDVKRNTSLSNYRC